MNLFDLSVWPADGGVQHMPGDEGWDVFSLEYRVDLPINTVLRKEVTRQRDRETRDSETLRQRDTETARERHRDSEAQRDTETVRHRETQRQ